MRLSAAKWSELVSGWETVLFREHPGKASWHDVRGKSPRADRQGPVASEAARSR